MAASQLYQAKEKIDLSIFSKQELSSFRLVSACNIFFAGTLRKWILIFLLSVRSNFGGLSGSEDRGGGDNSIQFINFGRVGDKSFKEWRQKIGGWKGG